MTSTQVAEIIRTQLGGRRLVAMTGAKSFMAHGDQAGALSFRIGRNEKKVNYVKITLTRDDLYECEFGWIRGLNYTVRKTETGIHVEDLHACFERNTGMYLTL